MGLTVTSKGDGDYEIVPEGVYAAVCQRIIDLGTQPGSDQYPKPKHKVRFYWEIPELRIEYEGKDVPRIIHKNYTMSLDDRATLFKDLTSWRKKSFSDEERDSFELRKVVGAPCLITVAHNRAGNGKTYANVVAVTGLPKGTPKPELHAEVVYYEIEDGPNEVYEKFSQSLKDTISNAPEWDYSEQHPDDGPPPPEEDDIPF